MTPRTNSIYMNDSTYQYQSYEYARYARNYPPPQRIYQAVSLTKLCHVLPVGISALHLTKSYHFVSITPFVPPHPFHYAHDR